MNNSIKLLLATKNKNKIREIVSKLSHLSNITIISGEEALQFPDVIEDGTTFEENAVKKAQEISKYTGFAAMADDSGLVIDALKGRPGIYSARYGNCKNDDQRNDLILKEMHGKNERSARFVCVIAIAFPDGRLLTAEGICEGSIITEKRGSEGFGYDPVFLVKGTNLTMAEISMDEKNRISHRAQALDKTVKALEEIL